MTPNPTQRLVLVVEDDPIYAEHLLSKIREAGIPASLKHATRLDDAFAYVRGDAPYSERDVHPFPSIVLLDISLANESGFPVLQYLQKGGHLSGEKVRVIMLTASDSPLDRVEALRYGAISYIIKSPCCSPVVDLVRRFSSD